jgi:hypothetical protein
VYLDATDGSGIEDTARWVIVARVVESVKSVWRKLNMRVELRESKARASYRFTLALFSFTC